MGVTLGGLNEFGTIKGGFLLLRGVVLPATVSGGFINFAPELYLLGTNEYYSTFRGDTPLETVKVTDSKGQIYQSVRRKSGSKWETQSNVSGKVQCLLIREYSYSRHPAVVCLILGGLKSTLDGYERIGHVVLYGDSFDLKAIKNMNSKDILIL